MKYPPTLRIGGQTYRLEFAPLKDRSGDHDPLHLRIRVAKGLAPGAVAETICHEVLHGLFGFAGLSQQPKFAKMEEEIVIRLSPLFLLWIAQNKKLIACLQEAMES